MVQPGTCNTVNYDFICERRQKTKHPNTVTNLLFVHYLFFFPPSSFPQLLKYFLKLIVKNVKAVPKHLDCFTWNMQQCLLLEGVIKNVLVFWSLTQLLDFVVHHSWISDYFVLMVVLEGKVTGAFPCR